jgi:hypothetical protein
VKCTLAYWHKPLFSSGAAHGNAPEMKPVWDALYSADAEIVIGGHDHDYERFAPQHATIRRSHFARLQLRRHRQASFASSASLNREPRRRRGMH